MQPWVAGLTLLSFLPPATTGFRLFFSFFFSFLFFFSLSVIFIRSLPFFFISPSSPPKSGRETHHPHRRGIHYGNITIPYNLDWRLSLEHLPPILQAPEVSFRNRVIIELPYPRIDVYIKPEPRYSAIHMVREERTAAQTRNTDEVTLTTTRFSRVGWCPPGKIRE